MYSSGLGMIMPTDTYIESTIMYMLRYRRDPDISSVHGINCYCTLVPEVP